MIVSRYLALFCLLVPTAPSYADPADGNTSFPLIRVLDSAGNPLPGARAAVRKEVHIPNFIDGWYTADNDGRICIDIDRAKGHWGTAIAEGDYRVMLRHEGYAPSTLRVDVPSTQTEISAVMDPGQVVEFQVRPYADTQLPADLLPVVVDSRVSTTTLRSFHPGSDYNHLGEPLRLFDVQKIDHTTFQTRVPDGLDFPLLVVVNHPDYMLNYVSREFTPDEFRQGKAIAELPVPGQFKVQVQQEETTATDVFEITEISAGFWLTGDSAPGEVLTAATSATQVINTIVSGLLPGQYQVSISGSLAITDDDSKQFPSYAKPAINHYPDATTVTAGGKASLEYEYPLLPRNHFDGDGSATITFKYANGRSTKGLPYRVLGNTETYQNIPIRKGTIPEDGTVSVTGLRRKDIRYYDLQVGTVSSSIITFSNDTHLSATRYIAPAKGDVAPELMAWDLETSEPLSIADLKGKIILLEFWATWCGPCQPNMQKLIESARALPPDLQDDVALVSISVDDSPEEVRKRLKEKDWNTDNIRHYWYGPGKPSARGGPYGVTGIPHAVIIGKDGTIAVPNYHVSDNMVETLRKLQE